MRRDPKTGDVILSSKPDSWDGLFALYDDRDMPDDYLGRADRDQPPLGRDPFEDW